MDQWLWFLAVAGGPVILGVAFAYALFRRRRLSRREAEAQREATREVYRQGH
ncbi:hypothetical protein N1F89_01530 [Aquibium sp. A9E412]|uniref:hypothetical protein n=1 Tax=Aquibium sp. A9E412 TaxID=2976767 RepID=UPI0025B160DD|nr:hypothetical protein [Aquibium sp. A9E412]MDN2564890.1 hypothetical protein [Aquibium sp. A9E412]